MHTSEKPALRPRPKLLILIASCAALLIGLFAAAPAYASYDFNNFDVSFENADGSAATQAGSHPFAMTTSFGINYSGSPSIPDGDIKDTIVEQVRGLFGDATVMPTCSTLDFLTRVPFSVDNYCPNDSAVGATWQEVIAPGNRQVAVVYNLPPPPGAAVRIGFMILGIPITVDVGVKQSPEYNVTASLFNAPQPVNIYGSHVQLWGYPGDPAHDPYRGHCLHLGYVEGGVFESEGNCSVGLPAKPFLTLPTHCGAPDETRYETTSWQEPGIWKRGGVLTHDDSEPPNPQASPAAANSASPRAPKRR